MAPVVTAALGALGPLLAKLTDLLAKECGRLKCVRRQIRSLRSELMGMHGALRKYTDLVDPDEQVKEWISLVRELAYDTEDCFDKFIHHLGDGGPKEAGFKEFFRKMARRLKTLGARHGIANQIDDLNLRIKEVKELKTSYKLDDVAGSSSGNAAVDPRLAALFAEEAHLVGLDGPRDDLAKWVMEDENKHGHKVLSIVGFGGLGKTTLANEVSRKIRGCFDCHAFVSVSQKPNTMKIIKDVISQVSNSDEFKKDIETWDEKKSISKLRELLKEKRLVLQARGFQCLKEFVYEPYSAGARAFLFQKGALPKLEKLTLWLCASMAKAYGFYLGSKSPSQPSQVFHKVMKEWQEGQETVELKYIWGWLDCNGA
ncbi:hypothetical protein ZWY2020_054385 [Hordeum vulgare]|nr:hypothetical protein ZWY2020_054385 [Hordeum vulgare]